MVCKEIQERSVEVDVGEKMCGFPCAFVRKDEVFVPIYFGVACALAALHRNANKKMVMFLPLHKNGGGKTIEQILKGAAQLLGWLVWKMAEQQWKLEKYEFVNKVARAEADVAEMKKLRAEDAKANEKVVSMFATQEHNWKTERKHLTQQIEVLLQQQQQPCSECISKEQTISDLSEKEVLMVADLQNKLSIAHDDVEELREKLAKESEERHTEFRRHKAAFIDFVSNQRQMKAEMAHALSLVQSHQRERETLLHENRQAQAHNLTLSSKIAHLEKELHAKEELMSEALNRSNAHTKQMELLEKELSISRALRKQAEIEVERWTRRCQGKKDKDSSTIARHYPWRLRRTFASRADSTSTCDLYTQLKQLQAEEIQNMQIKYAKQVEYLQHKISKYEEKLTELEASILSHLGHTETSNPQLQLGSSHNDSASTDLVEMRDADADSLATDHLLQFKQTLQPRNMDPVTPRVLYGFEDWTKLEKTRHGKNLWQDLDAFSRQQKVKNQRMDAFHWRMHSMERVMTKLQSEIEILKCNLEQAREEKKTLEGLLVEKCRDLESMKERLDWHQNSLHDEIYYTRPHEMDADAMQLELRAMKRKLRDREQEHRIALIKVLEEVENELQDKDYKLAVTEAKLIQARIQYEQERKSKQKLMSQITEKTSASQGCSLDPGTSDEEHESCLQNTTRAAGLEVEKLSQTVRNARDRMMLMENYHEKQLTDLIEKAAKVSKAGCQLRTMKNLLQSAQVKIENSAQHNMSKTFQEPDSSVRDAYFHKKTIDVDKRGHVSHKAFNLENTKKHQEEDKTKPSESLAELAVCGDSHTSLKLNSHNEESQVSMMRNDKRNNYLSAGQQVFIQNSNVILKGKAISTVHSSTTMKKMEQSRDGGYSERKTQRQVHEWNLTLPQSVSEKKIYRNSDSTTNTSASSNNLLEG